MGDNNLEAVNTIMKTGKEPFLFNGNELLINVLSFWQWSTSELLGNALRGILAEFPDAHPIGLNPSADSLVILKKALFFTKTATVSFTLLNKNIDFSFIFIPSI